MTAESTDPQQDEQRGCFRWELVVAFMALLLVMLGYQLYRKLEGVDPLQRCKGAYDNVHTAVDTSLVDGIAVRVADTRTTCGALRHGGQLDSLAPRGPQGGGLMPPPPGGAGVRPR